MPAETVLETHSLGKRYGSRWVVHELNLRVCRGDIFGFLGPNGAGKSTTIRMLLSLVRPTSGSVELFGLPLHRHRQEVLARVGGLVESPDFYLYLSARKNLEIVAALAGGVPERSIDEVLEIVSLTNRADDRVKTFSHGMKQRLGIAQALLGSPDFIILDEPTSGLDPQGIKEVRELIRRLSFERSMTVLLSSHLLSEIEQTATSMAIINGGRLIVQGGVGELLATGEVHVQIDARPLEQAIVLLQRHPGVSDLKRNNAFVECTVSQDIVGRLNRLLVDGGVEVRAFVPKRSLEEYFLAITEGASEVAPSGRRRQG